MTLGAASGFALLGTTVTCVGPGSVIGDVGATTFTAGACTFEGAVPPATNSAAALAQAALTTAYNAIQNGACTPLTLNNTGTNSARNLSTLSGVTLAPGTYCIDDAAKTGTLTLAGPSTGVWIFKIGTSGTGALTGTNFSVVMDKGALACNVTWWVAQAATMTDSDLKGSILAGAATTLTRGTLIGGDFAKAGVTITGTAVIGCAALKGKKHDCRDDDDDDDEDDDDKKKGENKGNPFGKKDKDD